MKKGGKGGVTRGGKGGRERRCGRERITWDGKEGDYMLV